MEILHTLSLDLETRSSVDIAKCGVYKYAESPDFEILLFGVSFDHGPITVYDLACGDEVPEELIAALSDECVTKFAYNASFERICLSVWLRRNYPQHFHSYSIPGDPVQNYLDPSSWKCTLVWAAYNGLPLGLEKVGAVLGFEEQKLKTVTTDFLTKKRVVNKGIVPQYYVEGSHEAIIPRELFMQVKEEMQRRVRVETSTGKRRTYSGKYALSYHVYCAHCGDIFRRSQWFIRGERIPVWRCVSRLEKRKNDVNCPSRTLYEKDLHAAVVTAFNQMIAMKDEFLPGMKLATERAISQTNGPQVAEIDERLKALQKELIKRANAKQNFDELADEINVLQEDKQALLLEDANRTGIKQRLDELEAFLNEQQTGVTDYDEGMGRKLIERITVYDDHLAFEFKCGIESEVQM